MPGLLGNGRASSIRSRCHFPRAPISLPRPFPCFARSPCISRFADGSCRSSAILHANLRSLPPTAAEAVRRVLAERKNILSRVHPIMDRTIIAMKMRTHGDYHLGQVLYTGKDFVIIDLEGEPNRPLTERRLKQPALRDIAGRIRSFHYAAHVSLRRRGDATGRRYRVPAALGRPLARLCDWSVPPLVSQEWPGHSRRAE